MTAWTQYFGLIELGTGDNFYANGAQFSTSDRVVIDAVLHLGATAHVHDGASSSASNPSLAPTLVQSATGGNIPAGTTVYYEYTFVNAIGLETAPSSISSITTPAAIASPSAPTVTPTTGTGTLPLGSYQYKLTNYQTISTQETLASSATVSILTAEGENVLTWTNTAGTGGVNIYQLAPGGSQFLWLTSVAYGTTTYTDNGGTGVNCNRSTPISNTTNTQNEVALTLQSPPAGFTTNLYRTYSSGLWGGSQIATGVSGTTYTDTGTSALGYTPPTTSRIPSDPPKIILTGGANVTGVLPTSMVAAFPFIVTFAFPGLVAEENGLSVWVSPFTACTVVNVRASLGVGSTPAARNVVVDVTKGPAISGNPPTFTSIFGGATPVYPFVPVGEEIGATQAPPGTVTLAAGDALAVNILQNGGGATPTDEYLTVHIYLLVTP